MAKIGSPLFILREECGKDLMSVLERLAEIGFDGVEFLGMFGHKPSVLKKKLESLGLAAIGDHVSFDDFVKNTVRIIDEHKELGCKYITIGAPGEDGLPGGANYSITKKEVERIGGPMKLCGMKLLFLNHAGELKNMLNGKSVLENIFDDVHQDLLFLEPDFGWMSIGGADPVYYYKKYKDRCPVVHFKDYMPNADGFTFRPTGYGIMNNAELYSLTLSCGSLPEWYVMDHDCAYERDSFDDLALSLDYFKNLIKITK